MRDVLASLPEENLDLLEEALVEAFPGLDLDELITHRFAGGVYAREMLIPRGVMVISMVHKAECISACSSGAIWVWTAGTGESWRLIEAPFAAVTTPGTRRVGIAERDAVWTTYHATDSEDVAEIEKELYDERSLLRRESLKRRAEELAEKRDYVFRSVRAMSNGGMSCLAR